MKRSTEDKVTRTILGLTIAAGLATPAWSHVWGDPSPCTKTEDTGGLVCVIPGAWPTQYEPTGDPYGDPRYQYDGHVPYPGQVRGKVYGITAEDDPEWNCTTHGNGRCD